MMRTLGSWLLVTTMGITASACVPVQPSSHDLRGTWRVAWTCGTERVDLRSDGTYTQEVDYAGGGHATHSGAWTVEPSKSRFEGAKVVLKDAMLFCSVFGDRLPEPEKSDRRLEAIWEWGRVILSFNPDLQGFERQ